MRDLYPRHGRRRRWFAPWRVICRCGLEAYPCTVVKMLGRSQRQANAGPAWNEPTRRTPMIRPDRPLLTPGQKARSRQAEHRWTGGQ